MELKELIREKRDSRSLTTLGSYWPLSTGRDLHYFTVLAIRAGPYQKKPRHQQWGPHLQSIDCRLKLFTNLIILVPYRQLHEDVTYTNFTNCLWHVLPLMVWHTFILKKFTQWFSRSVVIINVIHKDIQTTHSHGSFVYFDHAQVSHVVVATFFCCIPFRMPHSTKNS